jgi:hypothetical protein
MKRMTLLAMLVLVPAAVRAEEPQAAQPAAPAATAAKPPEAQAAQAPDAKAAESRPYVDAALAFLKGMTHTSRSGDAGDQAWAEVQANAAPNMTLKVAGKDLQIDPAGKKADARLVRFQKLSTMRQGPLVMGVTLENVEMKVGEDAHSGKGTVRMEEKDGKWIVTALEVD